MEGRLSHFEIEVCWVVRQRTHEKYNEFFDQPVFFAQLMNLGNGKTEFANGTGADL